MWTAASEISTIKFVLKDSGWEGKAQFQRMR
jgi:hypothetical protein